jgi:hypothetical protein
LVLTISSGLEGVTGAEGLQLDGDWTNPTGFDDTTANGVFPSGNGAAGGDFVFYFTVPSPADFNLDGKVDDIDASILGAHYFQQVPVWGSGDANGDGMANTPDAAIFAYHWGTDFTTWPSEQEKSGGGSKRFASRDLELALETPSLSVTTSARRTNPARSSGKIIIGTGLSMIFSGSIANWRRSSSSE